MLIRKFRKKDAKQASRVIRNSVSTNQSLTKEAVRKIKRETSPSNLVQSSKSIDYYVYEEDENILGIGALFHNEVRTIYVLPKFQRKRIGSEILREIENTARRKKLTWLFLFTYPQAEKFYSSNGFSAVRRSRERDMEYVYMEKELK